MDCVQRALDDAHLTAAAIDKVVLVGGSTRTPLVRTPRRTARAAGSSGSESRPVRGDGRGDPGRDHRRRRRRGGPGGHHAALARHPLPGRLAAASTFAYHFAPIIHRNTPLPASRSEAFHTVHDGQTEVEIDVLSGRE